MDKIMYLELFHECEWFLSPALPLQLLTLQASRKEVTFSPTATQIIQQILQIFFSQLFWHLQIKYEWKQLHPPTREILFYRILIIITFLFSYCPAVVRMRLKGQSHEKVWDVRFGVNHRYLMSRLSLQVFFLWRHVLSTARHFYYGGQI
jgi:hypothetical protein